MATVDTIKSSFRSWIGFFLQDDLGTGAIVEQITPYTVARFRRWRMQAHSYEVEWGGKVYRNVSKGVTAETVQRNIEDLRAALNHAQGERRIVAPKIPSVDKKLRSPARDTLLTQQELGAIFGYAQQDIGAWRWIALMLATASRPETIAWVTNLGANHVINHREDLITQMQAIEIPQVDYILCSNDTDAYFHTMAELIKPQGKICSIVETAAPVNLDLLKSKSAMFVWEFMFTRSMFKTADMIEQHHILERVAKLIDNGTLRTTVNEVKSPINAANLRAAHAQLESGSTIGKLVLSGWN